MISDESSHQPIFWNSASKLIPLRPESPESIGEESREHWYDKEYAGWQVVKARQPLPPGNGVRGKRIVAFLAGNHPYLSAYQVGLNRAAERFGLILEILNSEWDPILQEEQVEEILVKAPDLILLMPETNLDSSYLYKRIYDAGIPVIASNMLPDNIGFKYILSWTGPDDWEQSRSLARRFARLLNGEGGYGIICHLQNTSAFYARKWGVITELNEKYPQMKCLAAESGNLNRERTKEVVSDWLNIHGSELKGIICADDNVSQLGINDALEAAGRTDVIRAANGSTSIGIKLNNENKLDIITWQDPEMDGELPIQVAVDWFNGLQIAPMRYLPVRILEKSNISSIVSKDTPFSESDPDLLFRCIMEADSGGINLYFDTILHDINNHPRLSQEYVQGFSIEILSNLLNLIKTESLDEKALIGSYDSLFKNLVRQRSFEATVNWLRTISLDICSSITEKRAVPKSMGRLIADYVEENYSTPMSLKTLSVHFNLSAPYLGQLFRDETHEVFSTYLNKLRIEKVCKLLDTSRISASQAGIDVGFSSSNYFFRTFQKYVGCSPVEYKNRGTDSVP